MINDVMQVAARATIFAKVEKNILLHSSSTEASSPENEEAEISVATSPPVQVASRIPRRSLSVSSSLSAVSAVSAVPAVNLMSPAFPNSHGPVMSMSTAYSESSPTSFPQHSMSPFPAHCKFPINPTGCVSPNQNLLHHLMLNQQYFLQQQGMATPFQSPGRLTLPTITSSTNSPALTSPESAEPRRSAVKRGRPQQAMEPESDDDPTVQKKRHRRLYARNYRAQLREKLDIADELKKQIEILKSSHENELLSLKNDHRDRMDKMKEWYLAELSKRDEMFGMLLRRTGTMTTSP